MRKREALATLDAVARMLAPDSDPELIPAIRPTDPSLFFQLEELASGSRVSYVTRRRHRGAVAAAA